MNPITLDIILPCYNPIEGWEENIIQSYAEITRAIPDIPIKLIVVNDGSGKGVTTQHIDKLTANISNFQYLHYEPNGGKGFALRKGINTSTAAFCIYTDVDFPYTTESLLTIWQNLDDNKTDIAAGIKDKNYYSHVPPFRRFISKLLRALTGFILRLKVTDTQCGLKGFNAKGKEIFLQTTINRYLFDLEFLYLASRNKSVRVTAIPIELKAGVQFSSMRAGILFAESINFFKIIFKRF